MKANQHYVPQFYLRGFASEQSSRAINLYRIPNRTYIKNASIRHQASRRFFYGEDGDVENALGPLEGEASRAIRRLHQYRCAPAPYSFDHQILLTFILLQRKRTPQAERDFIDSVNKPLAIAFRDDPRFNGIGREWILAPENTPATALGWSMWLWPILLDLRCTLLWTDVTPGFITSDSPVVYYNRFLENLRMHACNTGLMTRGLIVCLPVSPKALILIYDGATYKMKGRCSMIRIRNRRDVDEFNRLQLASADEIAYFDSSVDVGYLAHLVETVHDIRDARQIRVMEYRSVDSPNHSLIHTRSPEIRMNLSLSFMRIMRKATQDVDLSNEAIFRDPEMWDLVEEFLECVKNGNRSQEDFYFFLAEKGKLRPTPNSYRRYRDSR